MDFNIIKTIVIPTQENINPEEGDYLMDGLLYCGKCDTPKEGIFDFPNGQMKIRHLCKCAAEAYKRDQAEIKRRERNEHIAKMRKAGFPDKDMQGWNFSRDDHANEKLTSIAHKYVENFPRMLEAGKGLLFHGGVGTGKTFLAACIVNELISQGYPCMITNFSRLINTIQGMFEGKQEYIDKLNKFTLLVLDDFGIEANTEYRSETVHNIIDSRYNAGLPTIVTTNLSPQELKSPSDLRKSRMYSRLFEMCIPVAVQGADRRRQYLRDSVGEYKDLLGL